MRFGSVCSGIESASCAWEPLGWRAKFFAEIAPFPSRVLAHHYPDVPNHGDFTKITSEQASGIDLLVGGTPCQSFSIAGLRGGLADSRGNLALEFFRLADRARPRWIVWENVPGVLSNNGGRDFGSILGALGELGYGFAYRVLDAQFFGVPQRRRRVFVVGCLGDWRAPASVLFEPPRLRWDSAEGRGARRGVAGGVGTGAAVSSGRGWWSESGEVAATVRAQDSANKADTLIPLGAANDGITHTLRAEGFDASEDGTGRGTPLAIATTGGAAHCLTSHGQRLDAESETFVLGGSFDALSVAENQRGEVVTASVTQALSRGGGQAGAGLSGGDGARRRRL